ncbi:CatB-related O-acetyltransferase [Allonocardiopsis opalescens]|uniref:Virginiamycin A acetyltransferase n=1 Tax=Allonocardiopsis opalescens TaxID=1144618 RepID=A0A2T0Q6R5_9ACTN|nr:CatB-related O-acetyltransferase [Allonocardiopsis opalescens]PRX99529.1 virginiamycin A acetyltransferase [Allonocardiopsis opalescens]
MPDPAAVRPLDRAPNVVFLKPLVTSPLIEVGEYTYYDDPVAAERFETDNVLYNYGPERLVLGRFCQLAAGVRFVMPAGSHLMAGVSTYPFTMFDGAWQQRTLDTWSALRASPGDTVVGNDVWIGRGATIMPGVAIGDGAVVATAAVVTRDVAPYTIVGGNPAGVIRERFTREEASLLGRIAWWDWPIELVTEHAAVIMAGRVGELAELARRHGLLEGPGTQ